MIGARGLAGAAVVLALDAAALAPLIPVFGPRALAAPALGGLGAGAGVAIWCAVRGWARLPTVGAAVGVYLLAGPGLAVPELAAWGVAPSWAGARWSVEGLVAVWSLLMTAPTPVGAGGGLGLAPFALAYLAAAAGVSLAARLPRRRAPAALLAPGAVLVVALILGAKDSAAAGPLGVVGALLALAWAAWCARSLQPRRLAGLAAVVALAAVGGLAAAEVAGQRPRLVVRERVTPPFDPLDYPSPLAAYRSYLKPELSSAVLARVSGLPPGGVVKLAVMDRFDGLVWNVGGAGSPGGSGAFTRLPAADAAGLAPGQGQSQDGQPGEVTFVRLESARQLGVWLYSVGAPTAIAFEGRDAAGLREAVRWSRATGTLALTSPSADPVAYTLETAWRDYRPSAELIAAAGAGAVAAPEGVMVQAAALLAAAVAGQATSAGAKALALERHLQGGYYSDGQEGPGEGSGRAAVLAGHGAGRIAEFLEAEPMVGNAEQYAAAMALMARSLGLSARVVMGFAPGYGEGADGSERLGGGDGGASGADGAHTFTGEDMTAWVEVNLEGLGWVGFFPTPSRQDSPEPILEEPRPQPRPQLVQPPPAEARPSQEPEAAPEPVPVGSARPATPSAPAAAVGPLAAGAMAGGGAACALAAGALTVIAAKARRRRRRERRGGPAARVMAGWDEVIDQLRDLRLLGRPAPAETRRETAAAAPIRLRGLLSRLAWQCDAAAFGPPGAISERQARVHWEGVDRAGRAARGGLSRWRRLRARLALASWRRRPPPRGPKSAIGRGARPPRAPGSGTIGR
jgi:transglutaminase-like putative cysteine protease